MFSELDVKISKIMGRPFHEGPLSHEDGFSIRNGHVFKWPDGLEWRPSRDIDHAMEVVERMRVDCFSFECWQPSMGNYDKPWENPSPNAIVSFVCGMGPCSRHGTTIHNHHGAYDIAAETLPLAICTAALIALKVE